MHTAAAHSHGTTTSTTKQLTCASSTSRQPHSGLHRQHRAPRSVHAHAFNRVAERRDEAKDSQAQPSQTTQQRVSPPTIQPKPAITTTASRQQHSRGLTSYLKRILSYSHLPLASTLDAALGPTPTDTSLIADGMAASTPPPLPQEHSTAASSSSTSYSSAAWRFAARRLGRSASAASTTTAQPEVNIDHAALALLRERVAAGSTPSTRTDNFKLGLVVEGGGMRGCVSGGGLQALADLSIHTAFDAVYGSSAGAINGTFFLSRQRNGVDIYHDHIACAEFIDMKRFWSRQAGEAPALNLDYLVDHVMHHVMPLDWDAVLSSEVPLKVVASSLDALEPMLLQDFHSKEDLVECLKASANVPEVAGAPRNHRGHRLVDAAVFEPIPFRSAIADGCTHIIVLCTRPIPKRSTLDKALSEALQSVVKRYVLSPEYMVPAWRAEMEILVKDGMSQDDMLMRSLDEDSHTLPWFAGAHVYPLYPSAKATNFSPLCIDVPTLKTGVKEGRRVVLTTMKAALGGVLDFSGFEELADGVGSSSRSSSEDEEIFPASVASSGSNIVPLTQISRSITMERMNRMSKRYTDFSHHAK